VKERRSLWPDRNNNPQTRLEDRSRPQRHTDDPVVLIIVLNGAFMFGADLARALHARKEFLSCATRLNDGLLSDKCDAS
jgi:hypoxanthine-guanine phosphoribosyltransferase